ncbi:hypothetical protein CGSHi22421_01719 [Haemophilus influenzae R3021]|uniref:Uncharacterized protein n=1 Tax=Haemophilus influenzae R3021 TaxID=375432 RepID=A4N3B3_HAEIF|nr:hypothetical protein CGSHi22421_01719 [Haemophilus influenzae R3021]
MNNKELEIFLSELKEITSIESPTDSIEGVNRVAEWFIKKAEKQGLSYQRIPMTSPKVAEGLFVSNNLNAEQFDILFYCTHGYGFSCRNG